VTSFCFSISVNSCVTSSGWWFPFLFIRLYSRFDKVVLLLFEYQFYCRDGVGILPCISILILLSAAILSLKVPSLARSPRYSSRPFLSAFNVLLFIIGIPICLMAQAFFCWASFAALRSRHSLRYLTQSKSSSPSSSASCSSSSAVS
jgi:hypothetical protein